MADEDKKGGETACKDGDMMVVGPSLGGICPFVRHRPDHTVESGLARVRPADEPIPEGSLFLKHREGNAFDVHPVSKGGSDGAPSKGPAKVTTEAYRNGWENIFWPKKTPVGQA